MPEWAIDSWAYSPGSLAWRSAQYGFEQLPGLRLPPPAAHSRVVGVTHRSPPNPGVGAQPAPGRVRNPVVRKLRHGPPVARALPVAGVEPVPGRVGKRVVEHWNSPGVSLLAQWQAGRLALAGDNRPVRIPEIPREVELAEHIPRRH